MKQQGVLLDCDYLIALTVQSEQTHALAKEMFLRIAAYEQYILNTTLFELATVYSRKFGHKEACEVLNAIKTSSIRVLQVADVEAQAWEYFHTQRKKSTSFFDCAVLVAASAFHLSIASFDQFYPKSIRA